MKHLCLTAVVALLTLSAGDKPAPPKTEAQVEQPAVEPAPAPAPEQPKVPLTKRRTSELVEKNQAMAENPNLVETENKITGSDPLTTSFQGYVNASSRVNIAALKHNMDIVEASEGRKMTFAEIKDYMKTNNMSMNALPEYQTYAYDEKTGDFLVLEDVALKEKLHAEARAN